MNAFSGTNRWACTNCAKIKESRRLTVPYETEDSSSGGGHPPTESDGKATEEVAQQRVYCNASKQFLIFSPPLILTLHLKRFHQTLAGPKKVARHVSFPMELDLAPFCSSTALALPTLAAGQNKVGRVIVTGSYRWYTDRGLYGFLGAPQ